ncbi:MAG: hypothetical protein V4564_16200 [Pseudomonadota bacterium]|uniref:tetratricopeptide repeat protein n=1 Tax=Sphingomonas sp. ERG5 TaxID=1381597 RepID=UPI001F39FA88|nr:hypothetical protein [Sphingomonas sp. ERG5]
MARARIVQAAARLMGWVILAGIAGGAALLLWRIGVSRELWSFVGSALVLGAAGYALQGQPMLEGAPVKANARPIEVDAGLVELREAMVGRLRADTAYLTAADGMTRVGDTESAVRAILGGLHRYPDSLALWTGLGTALALHDGGHVSPTALFAFTQAARLAPKHPAPPFFTGLAYIRAGNFAQARPYWAHALALTPERVSYRPELAYRLALLDRLLADGDQTPR